VGRGAEVERGLRHRESLAVAPRLADVDARQHTPAHAHTRRPRAWASEHRHRTRAARLAHVCHALSGPGDLHELVQSLPRQLGALVDFDYLSLFLARETASSAQWYVLDSVEPSRLTPAYGVPIEAEHAVWVFNQQRPVVISWLDQDTRVSGVQSLLSARGFLSACTIPLTTAQRRLGSLHFAAVQPDAYPEEEGQFLSCVAEHVAVAVDHALRHTAFQREQERLQLLFELTNQVIAHAELREVLRGMTTRTRHVMRADVAVVVVPKAGSGRLRVAALDCPGGEGGLQEEALITWEGTLPERVFRTGQRVAGTLDDLRQTGLGHDPILAATGCQVGCVLPLVSHNQVLGTLGLGRRAEPAYTQDEVDFLMHVASRVALAVEHARASHQIAALKHTLAKETLSLEDGCRRDGHFAEIIGTSAALRRVLQQVELVAPTDTTVLLYGETGTGKELLARALHMLSTRRAQAFVKLNCAAIPTGLLESELFGHEKGAFTGAMAQRIGRFELAHRGTIFLDEVGEIPLEMQSKLLRVLQEREFERLGSSRTLRTDARLIAATNRDLAAMVEAQTFRADLFYRLSVFPIEVPPLRERPDDIPLLVRYFAQQCARRMRKTIDTIPAATMQAFVQYPWPGNIRELQNVIERAVILSPGPVLQVSHTDLTPRATEPVPAPHATCEAAGCTPMRHVLEETERQHILRVLKETHWVVAGPHGAAARLGMPRSTLQRRIQQLGLVRPRL
jgi:formate hydrogenlyase transcriptional activator